MILVTRLLLPSKNERQLSIKVSGSCIMDDQMALQQSHPVITVLAAFLRTNATDVIATTS
jgi:hypothetical protein